MIVDTILLILKILFLKEHKKNFAEIEANFTKFCEKIMYYELKHKNNWETR